VNEKFHEFIYKQKFSQVLNELQEIMMDQLFLNINNKMKKNEQ
jgi:hypothetical protein